MQIEIVTHCWRYHRQLTYQLSSLALYPPRVASITMTVFYSTTDDDTVRVLDFFGSIELPRVQWSWRALPPEHLFRRAIGRNLAAQATPAEWIWFADADYCFRGGCLDSLVGLAETHADTLLYPQSVQISRDHETGERTLQRASMPSVIDVMPTEFVPARLPRAIGGAQICAGAVARGVGYCGQFPKFQEPRATFDNFRDDVVFRKSLGTHGTPIAIDGVYRIRHMPS
jgi:hypothetical protein